MQFRIQFFIQRVHIHICLLYLLHKLEFVKFKLNLLAQEYVFRVFFFFFFFFSFFSVMHSDLFMFYWLIVCLKLNHQEAKSARIQCLQ